ncbi:hypothetical protein [Streptomyces sp. RP5T]|uniref:hypothetical protein n=1 Tax=Streptomyces sp. RP5T TaxID=2490848 RepID=UPI000F65360B|nr:hypothetical protein [Streptomyces sp. RP5T]RRR72723.1 hypothetical protein EHS43_38030 [Streptomyces sp. RP5T]
MFRIVRPRSMILLGAAIIVVGIAALAGAVWLVGLVTGGKVVGDPDLETGSDVAVCSDVKVHVWATVNLGTVTRPDNKKVDYDVEATGHNRDPFGRTLATSCQLASGAFGTRVEFRAPNLNKGRPFYVTGPTDRQHVLVVRLTHHADGTVTSTQELVIAR